MHLKRTIEREFRLLIYDPKHIIISCICTILIGILTWLSCDGISFIWKMSNHPPFTLPLAVIFFLWITAYILFGVLIALCLSCGCGGSLCLKATVAYLSTLFWCPLTLVAGICLCSVLSIVLSLLYLFSIARILLNYSVIAAISIVCLALFEVYILYFTVAFTLLN